VKGKAKACVLKTVMSPQFSVGAEVASRSFDDTSKSCLSNVPHMHPYDIWFFFFVQSLCMTDGLQRVEKDLPSATLTSKIYPLGPFMVEGQKKSL
jgi:hypothetical protein